MKQLLMACSLLLSYVCTQAMPVDRSAASNVAKHFLGKSVVENGFTAEARTRFASSSTAAPAFHIFNAEDGKGFVIVSGESSMPEVVGYSLNNTFDVAKMHPSIEGMLQNYASVVEEIRKGNASVEDFFSRSSLARKHRAAKTPIVVEPLCECEWGQDYPYNYLCPRVGDASCPVGCVATAMAQIMYHFKWPKVGTGSNAYASGISGVGVISSIFSEHEYTWDDMRLSLDENKSSQAALDAVSQLCYDCGIATRMNYGVNGSGTNDDLAMKALYTYFGYKASTLQYERRECYATQEEWDELVKSYLNNSSPVLYAGFTKKMEGHEFIIDGYDADGMFHVNWGWDGSANGYYSIATLAPVGTGMSFSEMQSMVCGFEPDITGEDKTPAQWRIYMMEPPTVAIDTVSVGSSFTFTDNTFYNYTRSAFTWTVGVGLYDKADNLVKVISSAKKKAYSIQLLSYYGQRDVKITATIPEGTPDGDYTLRSVFRQEGYDDFVLPDMLGGTELNKIPVMIEGGVAYFNKVSTFISTTSTDDVVLKTEYFDMQGRKLSTPAKGSIVIKCERLSDGSSKSYKVSVE